MTHTSENQNPEPGRGSRRNRRSSGQSSWWRRNRRQIGEEVVEEIIFLAVWRILWTPIRWVGRGLWRLIDFQ